MIPQYLQMVDMHLVRATNRTKEGIYLLSARNVLNHSLQLRRCRLYKS